MSAEQAGRRVREVARAEGYHRGAAMTFDSIARHCPPEWPARFIAEQAELAGFPVWTSAPDEAWRPA
jgi:hypothetical protein